MKFQKKPVVIDACRISPKVETNDPIERVRAMIEVEETLRVEGFPIEEWKWRGSSIIIPTLEGEMTASPGDWIIRGVKGEFYPCKPDIFEETYERVLGV